MLYKVRINVNTLTTIFSLKSQKILKNNTFFISGNTTEMQKTCQYLYQANDVFLDFSVG